MNNNLTFFIYPQRSEYPYTYILLSMTQRSLVKYLYISLFVTNLVKSDVNLYIGNQSKVIRIKAADYKILIPYDKSMIDNKILIIRADVSNSQNEVFVNSKRVINIELQKNKEPARSLLLTDFSKYLFDCFYYKSYSYILHLTPVFVLVNQLPGNSPSYPRNLSPDNCPSENQAPEFIAIRIFSP